VTLSITTNSDGDPAARIDRAAWGGRWMLC
jgi:hypothetical protein